MHAAGWILCPIRNETFGGTGEIDLLFEIERGINGRKAYGRHAIGQEISAPLIVDLEPGCETTRAAATQRRSRIYAQTLPELSPASSNGHICLWNNAARQRRVRIAMMLSSNGDSQLIRL